MLLKFFAALTWILMTPVVWVGAVAWRIRETSVRAHRLAVALPPGSKLQINCACHSGQMWYVVRYNEDTDDYTLSRTWPPEEGLRGRPNEDWAFKSLDPAVMIVEAARRPRKVTVF